MQASACQQVLLSLTKIENMLNLIGKMLIIIFIVLNLEYCGTTMIKFLSLFFMLNVVITQDNLLPVNNCLGNCAICDQDQLSTCSGQEFIQCAKGYSGQNCKIKQSYLSQLVLLDSGSTKLNHKGWVRQQLTQCVYQNSNKQVNKIHMLGIYVQFDANQITMQVHPWFQNYLVSFNLIRSSWTPYSDLLRVACYDQQQNQVCQYFIQYPRREEVDPEANRLRCRGEPFVVQKFQFDGSFVQNQKKLVLKFQGMMFSQSQWAITDVKVAFGCSRFLIFDQTDCRKCKQGFYLVRFANQSIDRCQPCPINCLECTSELKCLKCHQNYQIKNQICLNSNIQQNFPLNSSLSCSNREITVSKYSNFYQQIVTEIKTLKKHEKIKIVFYLYFAPSQYLNYSTVFVEVDGKEHMEIIGQQLYNNIDPVDVCKGFGASEVISVMRIQTPDFPMQKNNFLVKIKAKNLQKIAVSEIKVQYVIKQEVKNQNSSQNQKIQEKQNVSKDSSTLKEDEKVDNQNQIDMLQKEPKGEKQQNNIKDQAKAYENKQSQSKPSTKAQDQNEVLKQQQIGQKQNSENRQQNDKDIKQEQETQDKSPDVSDPKLNSTQDEQKIMDNSTQKTSNDNSSDQELTLSQTNNRTGQVKQSQNNSEPSQSNGLKKSEQREQNQTRSSQTDRNKQSKPIVNHSNNQQQSHNKNDIVRQIQKILKIKNDIKLQVIPNKNLLIRISYPIQIDHYPFLRASLKNKNIKIMPRVIEQTSTYQVLLFQLDYSLVNELISIEMLSSQTLAQNEKNISIGKQRLLQLGDALLGEIQLTRFDYLNQEEWNSINRLSVFYSIIALFTIFSTILLSFFSNSVITQKFSLLLQMMLLHLYIFSQYLPVNFSQTLAGLQRIQNLNYLYLSIQQSLFGKTLEHSQNQFAIFYKNFSFFKEVYYCIFINVVYLIWFAFLSVVKRRLEPGFILKDYDECGTVARIKFHTIKIAERSMSFWYQVWQYQYITFIWAALRQIHSLINTTYYDSISITKIAFSFLCLIVAIVLPFGTLYYLDKKYFRLDYFQYSHWYKNIFFLKLPQENLPSRHHRILIGLRNMRYLLFCVCIAFLKPYPIICLSLIIANHVFSLGYTKLASIEIKPFNSKLNIIEHILLIAMAICMIVCVKLSSIIETVQYLRIGHILITICLLLTLTGLTRVAYYLYHKINDQVSQNQLNDFKPPVQTAKVF